MYLAGAETEYAIDGVWDEFVDYDAHRDAAKRVHVSPYNIDWLTRSGMAAAKPALVPTAATHSAPPRHRSARSACDSGLSGRHLGPVRRKRGQAHGRRHVYDQLYGAGTGAVTIFADGTYSSGFNYSAPAIKGHWRPSGLHPSDWHGCGGPITTTEPAAATI